MTVEPESVRARWVAEQPAYAEYANGVRDNLRQIIASIGLHAERVEARAKEIESLVRKIPIHGYTTYEQVRDKAGARVVVHLQSDVDRAVAAIVRAYNCSPADIDDKRVVSDETWRRFDYRAVHVQVRGLLNGAHSDKECEVQVRTVCEDAWALMSHYLHYKSELPASAPTRRAHAALSALFEMADREYERQYQELWKDVPGARGVLYGIAPDFIRLSGGHEYDPSVSEFVIGVLLPLWHDTSEVVSTVLASVREHEEGLLTAFRRPGQREHSAYLYQPESLLVFNRLTTGGGADVREVWERGALPTRELERLAADFDLSLD